MRLSDYQRNKILTSGEAFIERLYHLNPPPEVFNSEPVQRFYELLPPDMAQVFTRLQELDEKYRGTPMAESGLLRVEPCAAARLKFEAPVEIVGPELAGMYTCSARLVMREQDGRYRLPVFEPVSAIAVDRDSVHYPALAAWAARNVRARRVVNNAKDVFRKIYMECNTPGQWHRVLPEWTMLLDERLAREVANAKRGSPWPRGLPTDVEFRKRVRGLVKVLAQCAPLPPYEATEYPIYLLNTERTSNGN
jgi:hypothetical protein